jgi:hypothetical protein
MIVTDKKFYVEKALYNNILFCIERWRNKHDNLLIIDGDEGIGKSEIARQIGYIYSYETKIPFSVENVFFDIEEMSEYARTQRNKIIIWDEAVLGGMAEDKYKDSQQELIKMLITSRKYGHFYIFVIPKIRKLADYIAEDRALALIRVYSPNMLDRGYFKSYAKEKKNLISQFERQKRKYSIDPDFRGKFTDCSNLNLIDMEAYENKKDKAILSIGNKKKQSNEKKHLKTLCNYLKDNKILTKKAISEVLDVEPSYITRLTNET